MSILFQLSALFLGIFLLFIGNGLYLTSAGVQLTALGISDWVIGAVNAAYFIGAVISGMAAHRIISKVGHIRSFSVFVAVIALCMLAHTLTADMLAWGFFRLLQGFCYYGLLMVAESWINEKSLNDQRARMMAAYEITYYSAFCIGVMFIALNWGLVQTFIVATMLMIAATLPLGLTRIAQPVLPAPERISVPRLANIVPLALAGSVCGGIVINGFFTMASVFTLKQGLSAQQTSLFLTSALLGGFCIQLPIGKFSDSYGRRNAIVLMSGIAAAAALLLSVVQWFDSLRGMVWLQYTAVFFFGAGGFCLYSLSVARANDVLNQDTRNGNLMEISRGLLFAYGIGSLLGPLLVGAAMYYLGSAGFALVFTVSTAALFAFALSQPGVARADRVQYVSTPGTASIYMAEIDPRTDENAVPHPVDPPPEENTDISPETPPEENTDISPETLPEENTGTSARTRAEKEQ